MRYLLLLLLSFNIFADHFIVKIKPNNPKHGELSIDADSQEDAEKKLVKWIDNTKVYRGKWSLDPKDKKKALISKTEIDELTGESREMHYLPSDFSAKIKDVSGEHKIKEDSLKLKT
jgi:hypothetical protein